MDMYKIQTNINAASVGFCTEASKQLMQQLRHDVTSMSISGTKAFIFILTFQIPFIALCWITRTNFDELILKTSKERKTSTVWWSSIYADALSLFQNCVAAVRVVMYMACISRVSSRSADAYL